MAAPSFTPRSPTIAAPPGRTLHLVDLENLVGARGPDQLPAGPAFERYLELAQWSPGDHVLVAAHPKLIEAIAFAPPVPSSAHAVRGTDAADTMLMALVPLAVVKRFDRLVIGSGDAIFLKLARAARDVDVAVLVIGRPEATAPAYRRGAFAFQAFDLLTSDVSERDVNIEQSATSFDRCLSERRSTPRRRRVHKTATGARLVVRGRRGSRRAGRPRSAEAA